MEALIAAKVKTDATDARGDTALIYASYTGNLAMVRVLCQGDISNLNHQNIDGYTALMRAVESGHLEVVRELLRYKPRLDLKDRAHQQNALFHALSRAEGDPDEGPHVDPRWDIATTLLEAGADSGLEPSDMPLLHRFCKMGKPSAVKWMIKSTRYLNARRPGDNNWKGWTPLMECTAADHENTEGATLAMQLLLNAGADPALCLKGSDGLPGASALMEACDYAQLAQVKMLIKAGANINFQTARGFSAVHMVAQLARYEILQVLLDNGALVTLRDDSDHTPLHRACMPFLGRESEAPERVLRGGADCVKLLLDRGARTDVHHWAGWTPLMEACSRGHVDVIHVLLEAGADPNRQNPVKMRWEGWTPLMYAATAVRNRIESCRVLIEEGHADMSIKNAKGRTAMKESWGEETRKYLDDKFSASNR